MPREGGILQKASEGVSIMPKKFKTIFSKEVTEVAKRFLETKP